MAAQIAIARGGAHTGRAYLEPAPFFGAADADIIGAGHHLAGLDLGAQPPQTLDLSLVSARLQHALPIAGRDAHRRYRLGLR